MSNVINNPGRMLSIVLKNALEQLGLEQNDFCEKMEFASEIMRAETIKNIYPAKKGFLTNIARTPLLVS